MQQFTIDHERCTKCGLCATDCPMGVIDMQDYPVMERAGCFACQHCLAVCPTGAVSILGRNPDDSTPLQGNLPDPQQLQILIKGRRSVRQYRDEPLDRHTIRDLIDLAAHAPTGVNVQSVRWTVIEDRETMDAFRRSLYGELEQVMPAEVGPDDHVLSFLALGLRLWTESGQDLILRGAPHLVITSSPKNAPCAKTDPVIALSYFELLLQSAGLGTLWDGMVIHALHMIPRLITELGIPSDHLIGYAMAFGKPAVTYQRTVERGPAQIHVYTGPA